MTKKCHKIVKKIREWFVFFDWMNKIYKESKIWVNHACIYFDFMWASFYGLKPNTVFFFELTPLIGIIAFECGRKWYNLWSYSWTPVFAQKRHEKSKLLPNINWFNQWKHYIHITPTTNLTFQKLYYFEFQMWLVTNKTTYPVNS